MIKTCLAKNFWKRFEEMFPKMSENVETPISRFQCFLYICCKCFQMETRWHISKYEEICFIVFDDPCSKLLHAKPIQFSLKYVTPSLKEKCNNLGATGFEHDSSHSR